MHIPIQLTDEEKVEATAMMERAKAMKKGYQCDPNRLKSIKYIDYMLNINDTLNYIF